MYRNARFWSTGATSDFGTNLSKKNMNEKNFEKKKH